MWAACPSRNTQKKCQILVQKNRSQQKPGTGTIKQHARVGLANRVPNVPAISTGKCYSKNMFPLKVIRKPTAQKHISYIKKMSSHNNVHLVRIAQNETEKPAARPCSTRAEASRQPTRCVDRNETPKQAEPPYQTKRQQHQIANHQETTTVANLRPRPVS